MRAWCVQKREQCTMSTALRQKAKTSHSLFGMVRKLGLNSSVRHAETNRLGLVKALKAVALDGAGQTEMKYGILWDGYWCIIFCFRHEFKVVSCSEQNSFRDAHLTRYGKCLFTSINENSRRKRQENRIKMQPDLDELREGLKTIPWYKHIIELSEAAIVKRNKANLIQEEFTTTKINVSDVENNDVVTEPIANKDECDDFKSDPRFIQMDLTSKSVVKVTYFEKDHMKKEDFSVCSPFKCV
jgi:hypothetical protein